MDKVLHTYIRQWDARFNYIAKCPFGVRDLVDHHDECYSGSGKHRCRWFVRYEWSGVHDGCIHCIHPPIAPSIEFIQLELFPKD